MCRLRVNNHSFPLESLLHGRNAAPVTIKDWNAVPGEVMEAPALDVALGATVELRCWAWLGLHDPAGLFQPGYSVIL